jgi:2-polyprenyl-3-methyl-5-hydroxy-6-metoxy-1,4-benzoquinol methylase
MQKYHNTEDKILESWVVNAQNWIETIEQGAIASRQLVTNQAIIDAVKQTNITTALDVGCGEGWLTRALNQAAIRTTGIDAVESLIQSAAQKGSGEYFVLSYQDLTAAEVPLKEKYEGAVINFALIGKESTEELLKALPRFLTARGRVIIQTLHPWAVIEHDSYESGWREGSWVGLPAAFVQPYQWYFRTLGDWVGLLHQAGFRVESVLEPLHPLTAKPASLILIGEVA